MAKFAATAALVLGAVALAATGVGAIAGAAAYGAAGTLTAVGTAATASTIASAASIGAAAAGLAGGLLAKKPTNDSPTPLTWRADPQAGTPYAMGRCYFGGNIVYRQAWGGKSNPNQTIITVYSGAGPIDAFEAFYVDNVQKTIGAGALVNIDDFGKMFCSTQLGHTPEASQLGALGPPGWTGQSKLSGYAASSITLVYDTKGKHTMTSTPQCGWVGRWARVYDARKDSTYPGGSGPQRRDDESTWAWSDNPGCHAHTWLIGRRQNGTLVLGVGMPDAGIIARQLVELANVCDANGWKLGGVAYSTEDKWQVFKRILQAGGAEPLRIAGQVGCLINTPRVSIGAIGIADISDQGRISVQATQYRKDRINAVVPGYMAEQSVTTQVNGQLQTSTTWTMTTAAPLIVDSYVAFDGRVRQREVRYELVQQLVQAGQLGRYEIENAREFGPISLPCKLRLYGYEPGDVLTVTLPENGLNGQDILLLNRELDPPTAGVTLTGRSETAAKHPFALGQTTIAPATPTVSGSPLLPVPGPQAWEIVATAITANGTTVPALVVAGAVDDGAVDAVVFEFRADATGADDGMGWNSAGVAPPSTTAYPITGVKDGTVYEVAVSYRRGSGIGDRLVLGPVTAGQTSVPWGTGVSDPDGTKPDDNAVNTRNPSAPFGGQTVAYVLDSLGQVIVKIGDADLAGLRADLDINIDNFNGLAQLTKTRDDVMMARTTLKGQAIGTVVLNEINRTDDVVETVSLIGAKNSAGTGLIINLQTVMSDDKTTLAQYISSVVADNPDGTLTARVSSLEKATVDTSGNTIAKAVLSVEAGPSGAPAIGGYVLTSNGQYTTFDLLVDRTRMIRSDGTLLFQAGDVSAGQQADAVYMPNVIVDTLKVNTAMQPVRAVSSTYVQGQYAATTGVAAPRRSVLTAAIQVTVPGWIEVVAGMEMALAGGASGTNGPWSASVACQGEDDNYSLRGGGVMGENGFTTQASFYLSAAGTCTVDFMFEGFTNIQARERSMFVKFFPNTE